MRFPRGRSPTFVTAIAVDRPGEGRPMTTTRTLDVPGARLRYEVRGSGPLLLVMGSPMDAEAFGPLADALASDHTVVTHDPRGISGSTLDDPGQDSTPELRADDVAVLLDALDADCADVLGSSGGAVTGLALVARHPGRVRTLVAHEPPLLELLPDAAEQRAATEEIIATFHREGVGAAWTKFMANAGFDVDGGEEAAPTPPPGEPSEPSEQDLANSARFFAHELRGTTRYVPDIAALTAGSTRVVVGIGATSGGLITVGTSRALAERIGTAPVEFPGDHGGFVEQPKEFAERLREVLRG
ncbi:alpha/beta fold hydrolase [Streptomyces sp. NPDC002795]|uniref:alpha/beta fold hydrolase n=1 Tax=Streptomyces sp. NPDC002795 TaxID=3364665 RepID=UPI0036B32567